MIDCLLQREKKEKVSLHLYAQVFTDLGAVIFRSEALRFGASVAMTKVRPKAGTGAVTFPKPVFCGCFFFFFSSCCWGFFSFWWWCFLFQFLWRSPCSLQRLPKAHVPPWVGQAPVSLWISATNLAMQFWGLRETDIWGLNVQPDLYQHAPPADGGAGQEVPRDSFWLSPVCPRCPCRDHLSSVARAFLTVPHFVSLCQSSAASCVHCLFVPSTQASSSASAIALPFPLWY